MAVQEETQREEERDDEVEKEKDEPAVPCCT